MGEVEVEIEGERDTRRGVEGEVRAWQKEGEGVRRQIEGRTRRGERKRGK